MRRYLKLILSGAVISLAAVTITAQQGSSGGTHTGVKVVPAKSLQWTELKVPGFDPGAKMAIVSGNPEGTGLYTLRLSLPDGYKIPPHWHPMAENVTVLSGTFQVAMGERVDNSQLKSYEAGDFLYVAAKHPHFGSVRGTTIVQLHGEGPFAINLVQKN
jgi:quercetin dioxygenase-like cupin family protein